MQIKNLPQWHRQNLVALERVYQDIARFTGPVFYISSIAAGVYISCFAYLFMFSVPEDLSPMMVLLAWSAVVLVLVFPVFVLAVTIDMYLSRRIGKASRAGVSPEIV
ncbi:hypothetical protein LX82_03146 [Celeribacter halophilus]|uniref:Uncharacterized protein n=1 Tax=Celeribacter halophilus TaxID=576117 RepID=A0A1I3VVU5_9RHOB|nr:hypothetical protein LX82_03146 [Celeribacter halophilus]SFJ98437.1 hypothetical protein SAMN04488138_11768 [Celeribacter halophilus]